MKLYVHDEQDRLPTIDSIWGLLEEYRIFSKQPIEHRIEPIDALITGLLLERLPHSYIVHDYASIPTGGVSTLLAMTAANAREVRVSLLPAPLKSALESFQTSMTRNAVPFFEAADIAVTSNSAVAFFTFQKSNNKTLESVKELLAARPDTAILVFGVGQVGSCRILEALLAAFVSDSEWRIQLVREMAEGMGCSKLAVIARRGHAILNRTWQQTELLFTTNYSFLSVARELNQLRERVGFLERELEASRGITHKPIVRAALLARRVLIKAFRPFVWARSPK